MSTVKKTLAQMGVIAAVLVLAVMMSMLKSCNTVGPDLSPAAAKVTQ